MLLTKELLSIFDNDEPFSKKIKTADNAFKSSELSLPHKEAFLLVWIIKKIDMNNKESWELLRDWLNSDQFKELNRNDIDSEEIKTVIKLLQEKLILMKKLDDFTMPMVFNCFSLVIENRVFQHFFQYNVKVLLQFVSSVLDNIWCINSFEEFLRKDLFPKNIIAEEKFHKHFLQIILPSLTRSLIRFNNSDKIFQIASRLIQKCIFYKNHQIFGNFINGFYEDRISDKQTVPKVLFKYLLDFYLADKHKAKLKYKLILHAFCTAYDADFELVYKFLILLIHLIGFNLKDKLVFYKVSKLEVPQSELSLNKSQEIILELLDVLSENKNILDCKVKEITFTEFICNILRQLIYFHSPSETCYKIFIKVIAIDPLVIVPIIDDLIIYTMIADNENQREEYENIIVSIFDVYSKLHRIENLVSKMINVLSNFFNGENIVFVEVYEFIGQKDVALTTTTEANIKSENIFSKNILQYFSKCICKLASWQVINIFNTLLFHLNKHLGSIDNIENDNIKYFIFLEILSVLMSSLLCCIRVAEHTVASNVVEKSVKRLDDLKNLLKLYGIALLKREHNHILMRSFLNIAYNWAEMYITLEYYSISGEVQLQKLLDNDITPCNITYLHSYLNLQQWCLISERITNFGELPCKQLLEKLYIQKLRAMLLFEKTVSVDMISNVVKDIKPNIENNWENILQDRYVVNNLLYKMDSDTIIFLAEKLIVNKLENLGNLYKQPHILNSSLILTAVNFVAITKINKLLLKQKRKINEDTFKRPGSARIYALFTKDTFLHEETNTELIQSAKKIFHSHEDYQSNIVWKISEEKINKYLEILQNFPVIFSYEIVQKIYLLYFCSFHKDMSFEFRKGNYRSLQMGLEKLIIGVLQQCKFELVELFQTEFICKEIIQNCKEWETIFSLITENIFKSKDSIKTYEPLVIAFTEQLLTPQYMRACMIIINIINKLKKNKMSKDIKDVTNKYQIIICDKVLQLTTDSKPEGFLIEAYAWALRTFLLQNEEKLSKLLNSLDSYVEFAIKDTVYPERSGYLMLFTTILQNRSKIKSVDPDFPHEVWTACMQNEDTYSRSEEYSQLVILIFGHANIDKFNTITTDLLNITEEAVSQKEFIKFGKHMKTWESVISCNLNPIKLKVLCNALEKLLRKIISLIQYSSYDEELFQNIFKFEKSIIQTSHLHVSPAMTDMLLLSVTLLLHKEHEDFKNSFNLSVSLLECLLKFRKPLIMDRLPPYLQQYRLLLKGLCKRSNSEFNLEDITIIQLSDCSHQLEKLTKNLVSCQKDMGRIAMYLIGDILGQYEQITLYPNIKIHLNNCIYSLMSICDQHAIAYLMRVLTSASTEMFRVMYENYKKYYRFTGKV